MENNLTPNQEEPILPEILPDIQPLIFEPEFPEEPLSPEEELSEPEVLPMAPSFPPEDAAEEAAFLIGPADPLAENALSPEELAPIVPEADAIEEAPAPVEDTQPASIPNPSFMDRIPDVEEDYPEEAAAQADDTGPELLPILHEEPETETATDAEPVSSMSLPEEAPVQEPEVKTPQKTTRPRTTHKGRPKRKKGEGLFGIPNILVTVVWLALVVAIGVTLGRMLWICAADVLAFGREDKQVTITVYESDSMEQIVDKLYDNGLIRYKSLFNLYATISDAEEDIKPGIYDLNTRYDYHALVNFMSPSSSRSVIELTIPEGYTCRQIFALLEDNRVCTAVDIGAYAAEGELSDYWFLEGIERGSEYCLEGYLFPDTYQFYKNSTPREALEKMLDNFDNRFSEEMRAQIDVLNANVTGGSFTARDVVIVASLIEKESAAPSESGKIAGVIYNRLFNWDYPALLNIDAAIVYAQGGETDTIDTSIDSPYNTYRYTGLTPTPISNPGLYSLVAALNPTSHNYYYYLLNPGTGMHQFSTTQAEHDALIQQFYN